MEIFDDSDHGYCSSPLSKPLDLDRASDRVLPPELLHSHLVHQAGPLPISGHFSGKITACNQLHAEGCKIILICPDSLHENSFLICETFGNHSNRCGHRALTWDSIGPGDFDYARDLLQTGFNRLDVPEDLGIVDVGYQYLLFCESKIHIFHVSDLVPDDPCSDEQRDGHGKLGYNEHVAETPASCSCKTAPFEHLGGTEGR